MVYVMLYTMVYCIVYTKCRVYGMVYTTFIPFVTLYLGIYHVVYAIRYISLELWYIPSQSGINHGATARQPSRWSHSTWAPRGLSLNDAVAWGDQLV
jgi:hypothetical protein